MFYSGAGYLMILEPAPFVITSIHLMLNSYGLWRRKRLDLPHSVMSQNRLLFRWMSACLALLLFAATACLRAYAPSGVVTATHTRPT